jgi:hypothetical protein
MTVTRSAIRRFYLYRRVLAQQSRCEILPFRIRGCTLHPGTAELVTDYLEVAGQGGETAAPLFRPVKNNTGGTLEGAVTADGIYKDGEAVRDARGGEHRGVWRALTARHGGHQRARP